MANREFTGKHALMVFGGAFGIIIAVNLTLAYNAVRTFPGLEVKNSYVASQQFDAKRARQMALGWVVRAESQDGQILLHINGPDGAPVQVQELEAVLGRATHVQDDLEPDFVFDGKRYVADLDLADGNWNIRMKALSSDGTEFEQRVILHVER